MRDEMNNNKEEDDEESDVHSADESTITNDSMPKESLSDDSISSGTERPKSPLNVKEFRYEDLEYWANYVPTRKKKKLQ